LKNYFNYLINILFPERCLICGKEINVLTEYRYALCKDCHDLLEEIKEPRCTKCSIPLVKGVEKCTRCKTSSYTFISNFSLYNYHDWRVKELIYMYKFRVKKKLSYFFAEKLAEVINSRYRNLPVIPVPAEGKSVRRRGFDHIGLIADRLEKYYGMEIRHLLRKKIHTKEQKGLNFEERIGNLKGSIKINSKELLRLTKCEKKQVVLLDDIFTTGATAEECSKVLKKNGMQSIYIVTIAID